jgi:serine/threonine protein kinase
MPLLRVKCPECGAGLKSHRDIPAGKRIKCPRCANHFVAATGAEGNTPSDMKTSPLPPQTRNAVPTTQRLPGLENTVAGYEILRELGRGGMGIVYKARQLSLNRVVALKMILSGAQASPVEIHRFRAEAAAVAQLHHPNIVQIYEVGIDGGRQFLSLEFVNGSTLAVRVGGTPQPSRPAAELLEALARAIHVAHQRGIVHRDLKPHNVLLAPATEGSEFDTGTSAQYIQIFGIPKITDFGLAKNLDSQAGQTQTGVILGTPSYMAPEQAAGGIQSIGPAVDVYSLGAIFYEMLTGRPPFRAATPLETLRQAATQEPLPISQLQPYVPRDLQTICLKCLQKEPHRRYPSALALAEDLQRYLRGEPIKARPLGPGERAWRWCRRNPVPACLLMALALCTSFGLWHLSSLSDHLVRSAALESAAQQSEILLAVNDIYGDIVRRAKAGKLEVTHDYAGKNAAIPIPATFTIELGRQITDQSETGILVKLYSDFPFKNRRNGGPKDDFEREAIERLREKPAEPVYRFEDYKGRASLRYATARTMTQTCVDCHNTHPESPKTDWKVGDVRGVVEIIHPLDKDVARTQQGLKGTFVLMGGVSLGLLGLTGLALFVNHWRRRHVYYEDV